MQQSAKPDAALLIASRGYTAAHVAKLRDRQKIELDSVVLNTLQMWNEVA
jgi:hypothetical protein